ncbi:MAG: bifunctional adenosylcobinamide kinase/adenosylcobinamide-phosphate guanylyltransferase [Eubacteriaceae bacterium]|nr:bifunctional adenosylcobinamide kinase/adenosylcobinamide-phosphate guanylyltransferase [Eubacteriaceae bacterium]
MIVIFGGSHQGKTDFARKLLKLGEDDIYECCGTEADFSYRCISHLERLVLERLKADLPVFDWFDEHMEDFRDKVIICDDICCGVVPIEKLMRLYRDNVGKQMQIFCREADEVYRVYAGLGERLKGRREDAS